MERTYKQTNATKGIGTMIEVHHSLARYTVLERQKEKWQGGSYQQEQSRWGEKQLAYSGTFHVAQNF